MTAAFTIRLDDEMLAKLDALASDTDRSRNWIAKKAIASYVERNEWQIGRIQEGIGEADRGEFATDEEVEAVFSKYRAKPA
ncbi:MAG: CopG family transcriptional regulator [Hyphomicrobiales bacterium]|nr:MAG: CopG family transcriptional regulator [Hyphomicrobiales bacterium]